LCSAQNCPRGPGGSGGLGGALVHSSEREAGQTSPSQLHFARDQRHDTERVLTIPVKVLGGLWGPGASGGDWITKKLDSSTNLKSAYHLIVGRFKKSDNELDKMFLSLYAIKLGCRYRQQGVTRLTI